MKNKYLLLLAMGVLCLWTACKNEAPKEQATRFLTAFYQRNYDEAKKYTTERTASMLNMFKLMDASADSLPQQKFDEKALMASMQEPRINQDTCRISYQHPFVKDGTEEVVLLRINNEWKVEMSLDVIDPELKTLIGNMNTTLDSLGNEINSDTEESDTNSQVVIDVK
ncbi:MAG: hypothetical protein ACR2IL_04330 [Chitinophagaceae bacterium]